MRQFNLQVLAAVEIAGCTAAAELLAALGILRAHRHFWELCTLLAIRDGLRTDDVWVTSASSGPDSLTPHVP